MLRLILDVLDAFGRSYLKLLLRAVDMILAAWHWLNEDISPPKAPTDADADKQIYNTAVHEAGHLIAAWYCTEVIQVDFVTIEPDETRLGHLSFRIGMHPRAQHCKAVISIAGTTAELISFGKFRSGSCQNDLAGARIETKSPWPWKITAGGSLPFEKIFKIPPTPEEHRVLVQAYRMSKQLLTHYRKQHQIVVNALVEKRTLRTEDLEALLGKREGFVWSFWTLFDRGFILPQAKKTA